MSEKVYKSLSALVAFTLGVILMATAATAILGVYAIVSLVF